MKVDRKQAIDFLLTQPYKLGHLLGFTDLTSLHNDWIKKMFSCPDDNTLQAHRGSYKTTCVSIALALIIILKPKQRTIFLRKTDSDIKEVIAQVKKLLESQYLRYFVKCIYGSDLILTTASATEISTNLSISVKGTSQLIGLGIGASLTGKHADNIFTDDIVNINDRVSRAERERTKLIYQELQNIKNRGGRIFNTGTPWHADDCFSIMPKAEKYDYTVTGLISDEEIAQLREQMTASLFSANYELRHIADEDVIFTNPNINVEPTMAEQGECHIDAAYGGEDYTAFTICRVVDGKFYVYGRLWHKHIDDVENEIIAVKQAFNGGKIYCENNGDKGYLAKQLKSKGERVVSYHEDMNKFLKITSYLKAEWKNVYFVAGTDTEYINQICDYNENAEHDDAPDSLASIIRKLWKKKDKKEYAPIYM